MGRLLIGACAVAALLLAGAGNAYELDLSVDLRAVNSNATDSRLEGGLGKLRYDATDDGLRLGYLRLGYRVDLTQTLRLTAEAVAYGEPQSLSQVHAVTQAQITESQAVIRGVLAFAPEGRRLLSRDFTR